MVLSSSCQVVSGCVLVTPATVHPIVQCNTVSIIIIALLRATTTRVFLQWWHHTQFTSFAQFQPACLHHVLTDSLKSELQMVPT